VSHRFVFDGTFSTILRSIQHFLLYHGLFLWSLFSTCLLHIACPILTAIPIMSTYLFIPLINIYPPWLFSIPAYKLVYNCRHPILWLSLERPFPAQQCGLWKSRSLFVRQQPPAIPTSLTPTYVGRAPSPTSINAHTAVVGVITCSLLPLLSYVRCAPSIYSPSLFSTFDLRVSENQCNSEDLPFSFSFWFPYSWMNSWRPR